jgi:hypothetical protein
MTPPPNGILTEVANRPPRGLLYLGRGFMHFQAVRHPGFFSNVAVRFWSPFIASQGVFNAPPKKRSNAPTSIHWKRHWVWNRPQKAPNGRQTPILAHYSPFWFTLADFFSNFFVWLRSLLIGPKWFWFPKNGKMHTLAATGVRNGPRRVQHGPQSPLFGPLQPVLARGYL